MTNFRITGKAAKQILGAEGFCHATAMENIITYNDYKKFSPEDLLIQELVIVFKI